MKKLIILFYVILFIHVTLLNGAQANYLEEYLVNAAICNKIVRLNNHYIYEPVFLNDYDYLTSQYKEMRSSAQNTFNADYVSTQVVLGPVEESIWYSNFFITKNIEVQQQCVMTCLADTTFLYEPSNSYFTHNSFNQNNLTHVQHFESSQTHTRSLSQLNSRIVALYAITLLAALGTAAYNYKFLDFVFLAKK